MTPRPYENGPWGIRFVREVNLPNLQAVGGDFTISADTLYNLNLPALESVSGNFNVQTWKLGELDFSALKTVGANFYIMGRQSSSNIVAPEEIVFPSLAVVGNRLDLHVVIIRGKLHSRYCNRLGCFILRRWRWLRSLILVN